MKDEVRVVSLIDNLARQKLAAPIIIPKEPGTGRHQSPLGAKRVKGAVHVTRSTRTGLWGSCDGGENGETLVKGEIKDTVAVVK